MENIGRVTVLGRRRRDVGGGSEFRDVVVKFSV